MTRAAADLTRAELIAALRRPGLISPTNDAIADMLERDGTEIARLTDRVGRPGWDAATTLAAELDHALALIREVAVCECCEETQWYETVVYPPGLRARLTEAAR